MNLTHGTAWNPGLKPDLPREYRRLETIHRPENVFTEISAVDELSELTGLSPEQLVVFRPERLVVHELIVRVTADIVVPEGKEEEDLGKNFREIANRILACYLRPHMAEIQQAYAELRDRVQALIRQELSQSLFETEKIRPSGKRFALRGLFGKKRPSPALKESVQEKEIKVILAYKEKGLVSDDPLQKALYRGLYRVLGSITGKRGYLGSDRQLLINLVSDHVCSRFGSRVIGSAIAPFIEEAILREGYARVRESKEPTLISLKGASAAGKSSLRPMLKQIISERGIGANGYAIISPDIWRRLLLDYDSLGEAYKYAGRLTSHEVIIIDSKLDHYIRDKADRSLSVPHMMVDRFRFDSFASEKVAQILHGTYVKYVDTLYMYFVITPPEATVQRGWQRGLERGRYKAVEEFLGHSLEAYVGMPKVLFKWVSYDRPLFKYEFLDNSVPKGTYPKTIAYGTQKELTIINPAALIDIERYQKINIKAKSPAEVYPDDSVLSVKNNCDFLKQCIKRIPQVRFIDQATGTTYIQTDNGVFEIVDSDVFTSVLEDRQMAQIFVEIAPRIMVLA